MSSTPAGPASPSLYQLRVVLHGISPLIWRRLLVPAATSVAELHTILQTAFGWGDEHLHRFVVHGTEYGVDHLGGPFRDSILAITVVSRTRAAGVTLSLRLLFSHPMVAALAHVTAEPDVIVRDLDRPGLLG